MPRIDAITAAVEKMAATLAFYRLLGLEIPRRADEEGYVSVALSGAVRVSWSTRDVDGLLGRGHDADPVTRRLGLSVRCASPAEVDERCRVLAAAGHRVDDPPFDAPWGARCCRVRDPDGNLVELFAPLP